MQFRGQGNWTVFHELNSSPKWDARSGLGYRSGNLSGSGHSTVPPVTARTPRMFLDPCGIRQGVAMVEADVMG